MSISGSGDSALAQARSNAIDSAEQMISAGLPVFTCRLKPDGDPVPPVGWEQSPANPEAVGRWRPGRGLCGVTGVVYDVLDVDPRNGGKASWDRMAADLGDDGPEVYWQVATPSGGKHFYIAPLGIGSRPGFLPGIDLKGGMPDGESRGFVFMPPTERPSKVDGIMRSYLGRGEWTLPNGDEGCAALIKAIEGYEGEKRERRAKEPGGPSGGRAKTSALRQACLDAAPGGQRLALLRYCHEMERMGYEPADILVMLENITSLMPVYDIRRPWTKRDLRKLLHAPGEIIGDAAPGELAGVEEVSASLESAVGTSSIVESLSGVKPEMTEWFWVGYGAFGEMTVLDGEKGTAKTMIIMDIIARLTRGWPMPGMEEAICGPQNVIIFAEESNLAREIVPRLIVADADMERVFRRKHKPDKRGKAAGLVLPDSAPIFRRAIVEAGATVAVFDPITDFLAESIQTHNDASVRRALRPLGAALGELGCGGWLIRHMNKDSGARAKFRGAGTTAFQNRARVHLVTGHLPGHVVSDGRYGLSIVDTNLMRKEDRTLTYSVDDSEMDMDAQGNKVAQLTWHGYVDCSADELTQGGGKRPGPRAMEQEAIREVLEEVFGRGDTFPADQVIEELKAAGVSVNPVTLGKVKTSLGIRSIARRGEGKRGVREWMWTVLPPERQSVKGK